MLNRSYLTEYAVFAGLYGGGGNRTRVGFTPETLPMQELRWRVTEAGRREAGFVDHLRDTIYRRRHELVGAETNLYAVFDDQAVKVGVADDPLARLKTLQVSSSRPLLLLAACPGTVQLERLIHDTLSPHRVRGEWFRMNDQTCAVAELILCCAQVCADIAAADMEPCADDSIGFLADLLRHELEEMWAA